MEYTTLDKICENLDSQRKPITGSDRVEGSIPYYGASGVVDYVQDYIFDERLLLVSEDGANLLARSTPIAFSIEGKTWVNNHAHVLRFADNIKQKYVELYINSISLEPYITGSAQPKLNQKMLNEIPIPVVDRETMKMVVDAAEQVNQIISIRKKELEELDNLIKARFVELFGDPFDTTKWPVKELKDISESMIDGSNVNPDYYESEGDVLFLRIQNVWRNEFRLDDSAYISQEVNHKYYYETSLKTGDLLITKIGRYYTKDSSLGRVSLYRGKDDCANYSNNIMRVRLTDSVNSEFVNTLLNLDDYQSYIKRTSKGGTDKRALSKSLIGSYTIIIPPKSFQNEFADFVHQVDKSKFKEKLCYNKFEKKKIRYIFKKRLISMSQFILAD